jgi:hypothetical protein
MDKYKEIIINLNLGVGTYTCAVSARIFDNGNVSVIDPNHRDAGVASFTTKKNPEWATLVTRDTNIVISGPEYEHRFMRIKDMKLKDDYHKEFCREGILYPMAWDCVNRVCFRTPYFGDAKYLQLDDLIPSRLIKTENTNEFQVYQAGYTFTISYEVITDDVDRPTGRFVVAVKDVFAKFYIAPVCDEIIPLSYGVNTHMYRTFIDIMHTVKPEHNYYERLLGAIESGWRLKDFSRIKKEFADEPLVRI